jgi:hypothetical protein
LEAATSPFFVVTWPANSFRWKGKNFSNWPAVGETSCDSDGVIVYLLVQKGHLVPIEKWLPIQRKVVQV